jgi:hypothetical protein
VLIGYVDGEHHSTDAIRGRSPKGSQLIGRSRAGKFGECDTNREIERAGDYRCAEPSSTAAVRQQTTGFNLGALLLPVEQENGRHRCECSRDLQRQYGHSLSW